MKKITFLFLLISITTLISCGKNIDKNQLIGNWEFRFKNLPIKYNQLRIRNNEIIILDEFLFPEKGNFELDDNILNIFIQDKPNLEIEIEELSNDTMIILNSQYIRQNPSTSTDQIEFYEIAGISTGKKLNSDSNLRLIHFYKSEKGLTRIRCHAKIIEAKEIQSCLYGGFLSHVSIDKNRIKLFIGKNISLKDLEEIYMHFYSIGFRTIILVLNKNDDSEFEIFNDKIYFWKEDVEQFVKEMNLLTPPLPDEKFNSKEDFLKNPVNRIIQIDNLGDKGKLDGLSKNFMYLVSIKNSMSIESYISIKDILIDLKKFDNLNLLTEISNEKN